MTFLYDPGSGLLKTATQVSATVIPHTISHFEFWIFILLHLTFKVLFMTGHLPGADEPAHLLYVDWTNVHVITQITTFFEVFYSNHSYGRYLHLYTLTRKLLGAIYDFSLFLRFMFKTSCPAHARLCFRYFLGSCVVFFHEVQSKGHCHVSGDQWNQMIRQGLLKPNELDVLASLPQHARGLRLLQWCLDVVGVACEKAKSPPTLLKDGVERIINIRDLQQEIADVLALPVPFQYFHILNIMVLANITLWSYKMAMTFSCFAPFTFTLALLIFLGMMELASQLSNPFGHDDVDFPGYTWLEEFIETAYKLMENQSPGQYDNWERILAEEAPREDDAYKMIPRPESMSASESPSSWAGETRAIAHADQGQTHLAYQPLLQQPMTPSGADALDSRRDCGPPTLEQFSNRWASIPSCGDRGKLQKNNQELASGTQA